MVIAIEDRAAAIMWLLRSRYPSLFHSSAGPRYPLPRRASLVPRWVSMIVALAMVLQICVSSDAASLAEAMNLFARSMYAWNSLSAAADGAAGAESSLMLIANVFPGACSHAV